MHEQSLMKDLMVKIREVAAQQGVDRVVGVKVWLGALSHMSPEHFAEHFETSSAGTVAEGARITCESSVDINHPEAQDIRLLSIDVE